MTFVAMITFYIPACLFHLCPVILCGMTTIPLCDISPPVPCEMSQNPLLSYAKGARDTFTPLCAKMKIINFFKFLLQATCKILVNFCNFAFTHYPTCERL